MDKDSVKGAVNDAAGRAKRQVGEWTNDPDAQVEGTLQQAKGKAQKVVGAVKDAARDAQAEYDREKARDAEQQREHHEEHVHHNHP